MVSGVGTSSPGLDWVLGQSLSAAATVCLTVGLLSFAAHNLTFTNSTLRYITESSLAIYVLHHLPVIVFAYYIVQLHIGIGAKYLILVGSSVVTTMLFYHFLVRPSHILRFVLGCKPIDPGDVSNRKRLEEALDRDRAAVG
jgi:glucan biosynthesis protein C